VPDERCRACHEEPGPEEPAPGFSHAVHAEAAECQRCHASAGHEVTAEALREAGVFDEAAARRRAAAARVSDVASPDAGAANIEGHPEVACSRCHDMARTGCKACHEAPEEPDHARFTECGRCHRANAEWAFSHPSSGQDCRDCHRPPDEPDHAEWQRCTDCHRGAESWAFHHPSASDCDRCHSRPSNHFEGQCSRCHSPRRDFSEAVFDHPGIPGGEHASTSFACTECHPSGGSRVSCTCHGGGTTFTDD
jgi:hypothetical protein